VEKQGTATTSLRQHVENSAIQGLLCDVFSEVLHVCF